MIDAQGFQQIVQAAYGPLLLFARQWDENGAEDVVQTALMKFWQCFDHATPPDNAKAWLFQTVRNELKYRTRQQTTSKKHLEIHAQSKTPWFWPTPETKIDAATVAEELVLLPLEFREVIVAKIWGDLTFDEVATLLGISRSSAHRRYLEGLEQLRKRVTK